MTTTTTVPAKYDVGLDGRGYMIDTQYLEAYRSQTLDPIRRQADTSDSVGEASLNPEGYWRRSPESFHKGAGQARYDATDSDPERFHRSLGVDVWTEGQLSLLRDVDNTGVSPTLVGSTINKVIEVGARLLAIELNTSANMYLYTSIGVSPAVTTMAAPVGDITDLCESPDDSTLFFFVDTGRLYRAELLTVIADGDLSSATPWITDNPTNIRSVCSAGGRLLCVDTSGNLYDVSASGLATLPAPLTALAPGGFTFSATSANGYIYLFNGGAGESIFKTTVKADGSGLEVPTVAASLPNGEFLYNLFGYLGFVLIQSGNGMRLGVASADGSLTLGETFLDGEITSNVFGARRYRTRGQFIWVHGYDNPITGFGDPRGLVRLDLSVINDALVPAYAADLNYDNRAVFCYGVGEGDFFTLTSDGDLFTRSADYVSQGIIEVGEVSFGTREPKLYLDPVETASDGTVSHRFTLPDGSTVSNGNAGPTPAVGWRMALTPSVANADATLQYPILRALPAPAYIEIKSVPVLLHDQIINRQSQAERVDTDAQLDYLRGLRDAGTLIDYQDGGKTYQAQVIGVDWVASQRDLAGDQWNGTAVVRMKVLQ